MFSSKIDALHQVLGSQLQSVHNHKPSAACIEQGAFGCNEDAKDALSNGLLASRNLQHNGPTHGFKHSQHSNLSLLKPR